MKHKKQVQKSLSFEKSQKLTLGFMSPSLIIVSIIFLYPLIYALRTSFYRYNLVRPDRTAFIGFDNYVRAFTQDQRFLRSMSITVIYVLVSVVGVMVIGLIIAVLLNRKRYGKNVVKGGNYFRLAMIVPAVMAPAAAAGGLFRAAVFEYEYGLANYLCVLLGIGRQPWLFSPVHALAALIILEVWLRMPYSILILDAAVRRLPQDQFECATIDGASGFQKVVSLMLPAIRPQLLFTMVLQITLTFRQFDTAYLLTGGGPGDSTRVMTLYIYDEALNRLNFGYSQALSVIMLVLVGLFVFISVKFLGKTEAVSWYK